MEGSTDDLKHDMQQALRFVIKQRQEQLEHIEGYLEVKLIEVKSLRRQARGLKDLIKLFQESLDEEAT